MPAVFWIVAGCALVLQRLNRRRKGKDLYKVPLAPGSIPVLGHVGFVKAVSKHEVHKLWAQFASAGGESGVLRLCIAGDTKLLVTSPAAFAAALRTTTFLPKPAGIYCVFRMFGVKRDSFFTTADSAEHARVRKHLMRFFNADNIAAAVGTLGRQVSASIATITAACPSAGSTPTDHAATPGRPAKEIGAHPDDVTGDGVLVDAFEFAGCNVMSVVFAVFLDVALTPPLAEFNDTMAQANTVSMHPAQYWLLKHGLYPGGRRYRRNFDTLYSFHNKLIDAIYSKPAPAPGDTSLWAALRAAFPDAMTDAAQREAVISNASFMYAAGYETTANAVRHTLVCLALDQDSQTALAEEMADAGLLATPEQPSPPVITSDQLAGMQVLDAVCHESLRLLSPAPSGGFRDLNKDTKLGGYLLPKGTTIMFPAFALHYNPSVWGEDAAKWRPDRWLEGKSVASARKDANGNLRFMPFLDGPSNCIGQHLALVELKLMVAMVVSSLHVTLDAQRMAHLRSVEDYSQDTLSMLTLRAAQTSWLRMRPRADAA